jgi:predicted ATPase
LWNNGYFDKATDAASEAVRYAKESAHALTVAYALFYSGTTAALQRRITETNRLANELLELASERGFPFFLGCGLILQGWATAQQAEVAPAIDSPRVGGVS